MKFSTNLIDLQLIFNNIFLSLSLFILLILVIISIVNILINKNKDESFLNLFFKNVKIYKKIIILYLLFLWLQFFSYFNWNSNLKDKINICTDTYVSMTWSYTLINQENINNQYLNKKISLSSDCNVFIENWYKSKFKHNWINDFECYHNEDVWLLNKYYSFSWFNICM
jgi:hypothetical protein